ncbi:hypothetical protein LR392_15055 [Arthrobacter sp. AK04]|nr:hypothetical protein [Arthrobacter sp. AK04]MCD5343542.1 hypothetical protein [Arthrobacter sp. AK04]
MGSHKNVNVVGGLGQAQPLDRTCRSLDEEGPDTQAVRHTGHEGVA